MMKAKLQIRKFGPVKNVDIEIGKFNILIGPHASGKSTISKVLCVIHSFVDSQRKPKQAHFFITSKEENFFLLNNLLADYRIENFLNTDTYFYFEDEVFSFELSENKITIEQKKEENDNIGSYYFPAERIALPMISESLFELTRAQSTLPGYFLKFGQDFTIARRNQKIFNIALLEVEFEYKEGRNSISLKNNKSLFLEEASSAIQANVPLLVILAYPSQMASLFVIEELELHGFPSLQKELLYYVIERMKHPKLRHAYVMLPTHSPYILSAANNLLFAAKVGKQVPEKVNEIIKQNSWIQKDEFSAFYIDKGIATSIIDTKTGLINENELDGISEDLAGEFDALMELYKPVTA